MAVKVVVIVAVLLQLASSDFSSDGLKYDFGDFSDLIKGLENGTYHYPQNVTKKCFRSNREAFKCLAIELADLTTVVRDRFEKLFKKPEIDEAMKQYSDSFRQLPRTMWIPLEDLNYTTALEAIDIAGQTEYKTRLLVFGELSSNVTATQKAYTQFKKIEDSKKNKTQKLTVTVIRCLKKENSKLRPRVIRIQ